MTQSQMRPGLKRDEYVLQQQSMIQDHQRALQEGMPNVDTAVQTNVVPQYPIWPTSKPGPLSTPPPPGAKPINSLRSEQVAVINQESSEPKIPDLLQAPYDEQIDMRYLRPAKRKERL